MYRTGSPRSSGMGAVVFTLVLNFASGSPWNPYGGPVRFAIALGQERLRCGSSGRQRDREGSRWLLAGDSYKEDPHSKSSEDDRRPVLDIRKPVTARPRVGDVLS